MSEEQREEQLRLALARVDRQIESDRRWSERVRSNPRPGEVMYERMFGMFHGFVARPGQGGEE